MVFHVNYWDQLGWKDPFASQKFTQRQYDYQAFHQMRSVYTPGFFVNGYEWKGFFQRQPLPNQQSTRETPRGRLECRRGLSRHRTE
ncbi:MAG: hypothetical protein M2R46_01841 [Verrucomicrobia subdivision 3 bacterium]|nr:hypothetical protein [Limisphaerales bacterium]